MPFVTQWSRYVAGCPAFPIYTADSPASSLGRRSYLRAAVTIAYRLRGDASGWQSDSYQSFCLVLEFAVVRRWVDSAVVYVVRWVFRFSVLDLFLCTLSIVWFVVCDRAGPENFFRSLRSRTEIQQVTHSYRCAATASDSDVGPVDGPFTARCPAPLTFLADRTNGRPRYCCTVASLCLSSVTLCIVAKRCVLQQKSLLRAYRKSYIRNRLVPKWMTLTFV